MKVFQPEHLLDIWLSIFFIRYNVDFKQTFFVLSSYTKIKNCCSIVLCKYQTHQESVMFIRYMKSIITNEQDEFRNKRGSDETHIVILLTTK